MTETSPESDNDSRVDAAKNVPVAARGDRRGWSRGGCVGSH